MLLVIEASYDNETFQFKLDVNIKSFNKSFVMKLNIVASFIFYQTKLVIISTKIVAYGKNPFRIMKVLNVNFIVQNKLDQGLRLH